jgi:PKHD-type hydroxylase
MMIAIPGVLSPSELERCRALLGKAEWVDGNVTSGHQSALAKRNRQIVEDSAEAKEVGAIILAALGRTPLFIAAALPAKIFPPLFNRYGVGEGFGTHIDNAVRLKQGSEFRLRSDLSATLFLAGPEEYEGGELVVEDHLGAHSVKLPAGDMILYPASSLHRVTPVTRGERTASFFWIQSMVRDDGVRTMLFDLDSSIQTLAADRGHDDPAIIRLTGVYHNMLRRWADA